MSAKQTTRDKPASAAGARGSEWVKYATAAGILAGESAGRGDQARAIAVGKYLAGKVGRRVRVEVDGRTGTAVLRETKGRARTTLYRVEVLWDQAGDAPQPPVATGSEGGAPEPAASPTPPASPPPASPPPLPPAVPGNSETWE